VLRSILPQAATRDLRWNGFGQTAFGGLSITLQVGGQRRRRAMGQECYFHTSMRVPCRTCDVVSSAASWFWVGRGDLGDSRFPAG